MPRVDLPLAAELGLPKWPIEIDDILARRDQLVLQTRGYHGRLATEAVLDDIAECLRPMLPPMAWPLGVRAALAPLQGQRLQLADLRDFYHYLLGNSHRLAAGAEVLPGAVLRAPEWLHYQVLAAQLHRNRRRQLGFLFTLKAMTGTLCPQLTEKFWSDAQCERNARMLGFDRWRTRVRSIPRYPFSVGEEFVGLRFLACVYPLDGGGSAFDDIVVPGDLRTWNRRLLKLRFRVDPGYVCPQGFEADFPCHRCQFGYDRCRAATHPRTYQRGPCSVCGNPETWLDPGPDDNASRCIGCTRAAVMHS